jgi:hypothetical protein
VLKQRALVGSGAKGQGDRTEAELGGGILESEAGQERQSGHAKAEATKSGCFLLERSSGETHLRKWQPRPLKGQKARVCGFVKCGEATQHDVSLKPTARLP